MISGNLTLAASHLQAGRLPEAEAIARQTLRAEPGNANALHILGVATARAGRLGEAVDLLERAAAIDGGDPAVHADLGAALEALGRREAAAEAYRRAIEINPRLAGAHYNLGGVLEDLGRPDEAAGSYRRAIELRPNLAEAHFNLGGVLRALGRLDEAAAAYRRALDIQPAMARALANLGHVLQELGRHEEALDVLRRATECDPTFAGAYSNLGSALREAERFDEAVAAYRRAVELDPDFAEAHTNLGGALRALGDLDGAVAAHRRAIGLRARFPEAHVNLAIALLQGRNLPAALEACDAYLRTEPDNARVLALKAVVLDELGRRDEVRALVDFDRFIHRVKLAAPPGYANLAAFNRALADHILAHPTLVFAPTSHATRHGRHTGELLAGSKGPVAGLEAQINEAVAAYARALPHDPGHPFLTRPPKRWRLTVWSVVLEGQGHQVPHIHPAWLSGVYYAKVPQAVASEEGRRAGWIEFGRPNPQIPYTVEPDIRAYRPEEGLMVLFPSYFYHHTVPFGTGEQRISIAFDVIRDE